MENKLKKTNVGRLQHQDIIILICDMQTYKKSEIHKSDAFLLNAKKLCQVAKVLKIPVIIAEHFKEKYGETDPELKDELKDVDEVFFYEKILYSMVTKEFKIRVNEIVEKSCNRTKFVLIGRDSHVCVAQTCFDLIELGSEVHIVTDAVSSSQEIDRKIGIHRMENSGAFLTTFEMFLFELIKNQKMYEYNELFEVFNFGEDLKIENFKDF